MIQNWVEISVDLFREIFDSYISHKGNSADKVIEIQNPAEIYYGTNSRTFIGAGIDPFEFRTYNELMCQACESLEHGHPDKAESLREDINILNSCDIPKYISGPLISPIGATPENIKLWWVVHFGSISDMEALSSLKDKIDDFKVGVCWYFRDENGKIVYDMRRKNTATNEKDMLIRIRSIDLADWKKMIYETISINEFPAEYMKEDIKKEDFSKVLEK